MKKLWFMILLALSFACSKDESKESIVSRDDYFPNTPGTTWTYDGPLEGTMVVTSERKTFGDKVYSELVQEGAQSGASYLNKGSGDYYLRGFAGLGEIDLLVLKDDVDEGATWDQNITYQGTSAKVYYTLSQKNIEETIDGETFNNVIVVEVNVTTSAFGSALTVAALTFHFGKGVGIVRIETDYEVLTGLSGFNGTTDLVDYTIE
ncbi:hypothetical protein [Pseudochryseolinea flava]|nr:hypothetical protein [Pseudochryseolinea flava]